MCVLQYLSYGLVIHNEKIEDHVIELYDNFVHHEKVTIL